MLRGLVDAEWDVSTNALILLIGWPALDVLPLRLLPHPRSLPEGPKKETALARLQAPMASVPGAEPKQGGQVPCDTAHNLRLTCSYITRGGRAAGRCPVSEERIGRPWLRSGACTV